jgi:hypothetical protein
VIGEPAQRACSALDLAQGRIELRRGGRERAARRRRGLPEVRDDRPQVAREPFDLDEQPVGVPRDRVEPVDRALELGRAEDALGAGDQPVERRR